MGGRRLGDFLVVWSVGFALVHAAWALGWRAGVPADQPPIAERPVFLAYDVVAGLLMVAAAFVVVRLRHRRTRLLLRLTLVGALLALLRGVPALVIDVATGDFSGVGPMADAWFTVAGAAGLVLWRSARRTVDRDVVTSRPWAGGRPQGSA